MKIHKKINKKIIVVDKKSLLFDDVDYQLSCKSKKTYESAWLAKFAADEQYTTYFKKLTWYKCKYCGKWHLTSLEK